MDDETALAHTSDPPPELPDFPGFTHRYVETPGLRTHVAIIGRGEAILMLHGFPQHWWQWRHVAAGLADRYQLICPDLRGAGWTEAASPTMKRLTRMDDLFALMDALDLDRPHVVAHDNGAITAMHLAYFHPERVRSMVVLAVPPFFMPFSPRMLPALRHMPRLLLHRKGTSVAHVFEPPYVARPMPPEDIDTYLAPMARPEIDGSIRNLYRVAIAEMPRMAGGTYKRQRLSVPSLYAFGEQDKPLNQAFVEGLCGDTSRFADRLEFASVPGAAHFLTDDNPDAVGELVGDFVERVG